MDNFERKLLYIITVIGFIIWCVMWILFTTNNIINSNPKYPWHSTNLLINGGGLAFWSLMLIAGLIWIGHSYFKKEKKNNE